MPKPASHSRIAWASGQFEPRFPDDYIHVANVQAANLAEAADVTTHGSVILDGAAASWDRHPSARALVFAPRSTDTGDVIVDPTGRAYRVQQEGFAAIEVAAQRQAPDPVSPEQLTPSEIATVRDAAAVARGFLHGTAHDVENERTGQLSPPHTPGRGGR